MGSQKTLEMTEYFGLNSKTSEASLPWGFSRDLHDIDLSLPGVAQTRGGFVKLTQAALGYKAFRIHDFYKPSVQNHFFLGNGGSEVFKLSVLGVKSVVGSGLATNQIVDFLNYKNTCFYCNGVDSPKATDGFTQRNWGIVGPTTAPSVAPNGAGVLTGSYTYVVTFFNSNTSHESNHGLRATVTIAAQSVDLSNIPVSTDPQVTRRRIYRTVTGGSILLFLAEINDNVTTIYNDNTADASLGTTEAPEDNNPPPAFVGIEEWDGRIFGFEKRSTVLKFCNDEFLTSAGAGVPEESFSADNEIELVAEIRGIKKSPNFDELWVHTTKGVIAIKSNRDEPDDPYFPVFRNSNSAWASISHYSIQNIYNKQWFMTENAKVMSIDSSGFPDYESNLIESELTNANLTRLKFVQAVHYKKGTKNQYRFIFPEGGNIDFNKMWVANYLQRTPPDLLGKTYPVWEPHRIQTTCIGTVKDANEDDVLYTGSTDEHIMKQDFGTNDDGVAIDWSFSIGWSRTAQTPDITDLIRWIKAYFQPLGDYSINMRIDLDFGCGGGQVYAISLTQTGDLLDLNFILDISLLGCDGLRAVTTDVVGDYNYIQVTFFGNALNQIMELHNMLMMPVQTSGFRR